MDEMIERVGAALAKACLDEFGSTWSNDVRWKFARAAIGAMREPTDEMIKVGHANIAPWWSPAMVGSDDYGNTCKAAQSAFRGMIDAALATPPAEG